MIEDARLVESLGYDGLAVEETKVDPYVVMALAFESPHYNLSLMVPLFDPGPIEHPDIPIHVAAVNPTMCRSAS